MQIIKQQSPLNSYIDSDGTLHIVQDTSFSQPLRIYDDDIGDDIDLTNYEIKGLIKASPSDPVGTKFTITYPNPKQALVSLHYSVTKSLPSGFYYYEIEAINKTTDIKENLLKGRAIVHRNVS